MIAWLARAYARCPVCRGMGRAVRHHVRYVRDLAGVVYVRYNRHRCDACRHEWNVDSPAYPEGSKFSAAYVARAVELADDLPYAQAAETLRRETGHAPSASTIQTWHRAASARTR